MVVLYLRQENDDFVLQEDDSKLVIEENTLFAVDATAAASVQFSTQATLVADEWIDIPDSSDTWSTIPSDVNVWVDKSQGTNTWLRQG